MAKFNYELLTHRRRVAAELAQKKLSGKLRYSRSLRLGVLRDD